MTSSQPDPIDAFFKRMFTSIWFYISAALLVCAVLTWALWPTWEDKNTVMIQAECEKILQTPKDEYVFAFKRGQKMLEDIEGKRIKKPQNISKIYELKEFLEKIEKSVRKELDLIEAKEAAKKEKEDRALRAQAELENERQEKIRKDAELKAKYAKVGKTAKDALISLKKLAAFTEVGVTKIKYGEALGVAWGDIKVFVESVEGKTDYPELCTLFVEAIESYKKASENWEYQTSLQLYWSLAGSKVKEIDALINR
jgi:hypothetical protein